MTYCDPNPTTFDSDDLFAHWRDEDARIRLEELSDAKRDAAYAAAQAGDKDAVMRAWDEGMLDDATASLALYGCCCRRCRKSDPAGCTGYAL